MSDFLLSGKLPKICIHTPIEDQYSKYYEPEKVCECGCSEWKDSTTNILKNPDEFKLKPKDVHRCVKCSLIRIARLKEKKDEQ